MNAEPRYIIVTTWNGREGRDTEHKKALFISKESGPAGYEECMRWFHSHTSHSIHSALTEQGYAIVEQPPCGLTRKPRKGDRIGFGEFATGYIGPESMQLTIPPKTPLGTVDHLEGNLCWIKYDSTGVVLPFIWWFEREQGFNRLATILTEGAP